jgi:hypothetical protein
MSSNAASVQNVNRDTVIGYKSLRKGNRTSMFDLCLYQRNIDMY